MNSLLQSQIHESCKLGLPEGLKDLLSDISREVLRAQPRNLYQFIANYLESLLEVREALAIACRFCDETCECTWESGLRSELMELGINDDNLDEVIKIIDKYLRSGSVNEPSLFVKLMKKVSIDEFHIPSIQESIQRAFMRQNLENVKTNTKQSRVSMHLKTRVCVFSRSSTEIDEAKSDDYEQKTDQCYKITPNNTFENEPVNVDDEDLNSQSCDELNKEKCISDDDDGGDVLDYDEVDHPLVKFDQYDKEIDIINEDIINHESENDSTVSSITESLANSDDSIDEVF